MFFDCFFLCVCVLGKTVSLVWENNCISLSAFQNWRFFENKFMMNKRGIKIDFMKTAAIMLGLLTSRELDIKLAVKTERIPPKKSSMQHFKVALTFWRVPFRAL